MDRKKVLIIDDEADLCLLMKAYFLRKNYEVFISHDVDEALDTAAREQPHFILLNASLCSHPDAYIRRLRELVPGVEIRITNNPNKRW